MFSNFKFYMSLNINICTYQCTSGGYLKKEVHVHGEAEFSLKHFTRFYSTDLLDQQTDFFPICFSLRHFISPQCACTGGL